jgi:hypothetical protein
MTQCCFFRHHRPKGRLWQSDDIQNLYLNNPELRMTGTAADNIGGHFYLIFSGIVLGKQSIFIE